MASIFSAPGDTVQAERWDGLRLTLQATDGHQFIFNAATCQWVNP